MARRYAFQRPAAAIRAAAGVHPLYGGTALFGHPDCLLDAEPRPHAEHLLHFGMVDIERIRSAFGADRQTTGLDAVAGGGALLIFECSLCIELAAYMFRPAR